MHYWDVFDFVFQYVVLRRDLIAAAAKKYCSRKDPLTISDFPEKGNVKVRSKDRGKGDWTFVKEGPLLRFESQSGIPCMVKTPVAWDNNQLPPVEHLAAFFPFIELSEAVEPLRDGLGRLEKLGAIEASPFSDFQYQFAKNRSLASHLCCIWDKAIYAWRKKHNLVFWVVLFGGGLFSLVLAILRFLSGLPVEVGEIAGLWILAGPILIVLFVYYTWQSVRRH